MKGPMRYSMVIQWSDEDQLFICSLPEWGEGCKTHGTTYEEAFRNGVEVLEMLVDGEQAASFPAPWKFPSVTWPQAAGRQHQPAI